MNRTQGDDAQAETFWGEIKLFKDAILAASAAGVLNWGVQTDRINVNAIPPEWNSFATNEAPLPEELTLEAYSGTKDIEKLIDFRNDMEQWGKTLPPNIKTNVSFDFDENEARKMPVQINVNGTDYLIGVKMNDKIVYRFGFSNGPIVNGPYYDAMQLQVVYLSESIPNPDPDANADTNVSNYLNDLSTPLKDFYDLMASTCSGSLQDLIDSRAGQKFDTEKELVAVNAKIDSIDQQINALNNLKAPKVSELNTEHNKPDFEERILEAGTIVVDRETYRDIELIQRLETDISKMDKDIQSLESSKASYTAQKKAYEALRDSESKEQEIQKQLDDLNNGNNEEENERTREVCKEILELEEQLPGPVQEQSLGPGEMNDITQNIIQKVYDLRAQISDTSSAECQRLLKTLDTVEEDAQIHRDLFSDGRPAPPNTCKTLESYSEILDSQTLAELLDEELYLAAAEELRLDPCFDGRIKAIHKQIKAKGGKSVLKKRLEERLSTQKDTTKKAESEAAFERINSEESTIEFEWEKILTALLAMCVATRVAKVAYDTIVAVASKAAVNAFLPEDVLGNVKLLYEAENVEAIKQSLKRYASKDKMRSYNSVVDEYMKLYTSLYDDYLEKQLSGEVSEADVLSRYNTDWTTKIATHRPILETLLKDPFWTGLDTIRKEARIDQAYKLFNAQLLLKDKGSAGSYAKQLLCFLASFLDEANYTSFVNDLEPRNNNITKRQWSALENGFGVTFTKPKRNESQAMSRFLQANKATIKKILLDGSLASDENFKNTAQRVGTTVPGFSFMAVYVTRLSFISAGYRYGGIKGGFAAFAIQICIDNFEIIKKAFFIGRDCLRFFWQVAVDFYYRTSAEQKEPLEPDTVRTILIETPTSETSPQKAQETGITDSNSIFDQLGPNANVDQLESLLRRAQSSAPTVFTFANII